MTTDDRIKLGVQMAQKTGVGIGDACAHPSDPMTYKCVKIEGGVAFLSYGGIEKAFPADECFDPNIARDYAMRTLITQN